MNLWALPPLHPTFHPSKAGVTRQLSCSKAAAKHLWHPSSWPLSYVMKVWALSPLILLVERETERQRERERDLCYETQGSFYLRVIPKYRDEGYFDWKRLRVIVPPSILGRWYADAC